MVYMTSWEEVVERSVQLFRADPESTRYCMKYRHCPGKLVLKVTDNQQCLKFKTDRAQDVTEDGEAQQHVLSSDGSRSRWSDSLPLTLVALFPLQLTSSYFQDIANETKF